MVNKKWCACKVFLYNFSSFYNLCIPSVLCFPPTVFLSVFHSPLYLMLQLFPLFPLPTTCLPPSLKSLLYNLSPTHSFLMAPLCAVTRQMLRFNALIWLAVSPSISLILVHLVPSKTVWSNLGKLASTETDMGFCETTQFFLSLSLCFLRVLS